MCGGGGGRGEVTQTGQAGAGASSRSCRRVCVVLCWVEERVNNSKAGRANHAT